MDIPRRAEPAATRLPQPIARGKVRDVYDLGDRLMLVASDRISAFDVVMNEPVPGKGALLTRLTQFWLEHLRSAAPHHLLDVVSEDRPPAGFEPAAAWLAGRAMICVKAAVLPIECVARGYLVGGGWKEYRESGCVSGVSLPRGLRLAERFDQPIFTPSTKSASGHDEPVTFDECCRIADDFLERCRSDGRTPAVSRFVDGGELMRRARERTLALYEEAAAHAAARGVLLADTKFEFGLRISPQARAEGEPAELLLVDEVLTPDSSRYWPAESWRPGENPPSYDKQFLRDFLNSLSWPKTYPPPPIPADVIAQTAERYRRAFEALCRPA